MTQTRLRFRRSFIVAAGALAFLAGSTDSWRLLAQGPEPAKGVKFSQVSPADMKEWLSYLASDELQGRQIFTEGYGSAAQYIADLLKSWGVKPLGDDGTYFQLVRLRGYQVTRNSSVTVTVNGETRTFKHGDHVTFSVNSGGPQSLTFDAVEFLGYGQPGDLQGKDLKGKLAVTMPNLVPQTPGGGAGGGGGRGGRGGGGGQLIAAGAKAAIGLALTPPPPTPAEDALAKAQAALASATEAVAQAQQAVIQARGGRAGGGAGRAGGAGAGGGRGGRGAAPTPDITTVGRVDTIVVPQFTADETFYDFLLSGSPVKFADLRAKAEKGEPLATFPIAAKVAVAIDNEFDVVQMQISKNVVGMVEGSDPRLKDTYVLVGAHLDHIGYSTTGGGSLPAPSGCRRRSPEAIAAVEKAGKTIQNAGRGRGAAGAATPGGRGAAPALPPLEQRDFVSNGADDDGSGSTATLAVAKAFATGPKPKRSMVFVWHTGEEAGLYGSRYNAEFPVVPLDKVQAQLNMDMVGRDDCNNLEGDYTNSVFVVGADRISTDLHNLIVQTNKTMTKPLTLDYELNDASDPEGVYTRSDHYSYAAKGIPIAFFTTGLHPDYHRVTDTVEKITFPKMARIAQLVYETGYAIANTDKPLERDNKGPRTGFGTKPDGIR